MPQSLEVPPLDVGGLQSVCSWTMVWTSHYSEHKPCYLIHGLCKILAWLTSMYDSFYRKLLVQNILLRLISQNSAATCPNHSFKERTPQEFRLLDEIGIRIKLCICPSMRLIVARSLAGKVAGSQLKGLDMEA
ncbi:hypothetical protein Fmac_010935 [Flemingia macrophylla]|uniref:Uncharacterized protein n=1 Tax=Flemingia macrophylla TaxID=520843 RepID=A0ABD1ML19_9FABA